MSQNTGYVFFNRFVLKKKISSGAFGQVFLVYDKQTNQDCALKLERDDNEDMRSLEREVEILSKLNGADGTPKLIFHGTDSCFNALVLELLGRDLSYYFRQQKRFSLKCAIQIAYESVCILRNIHQEGVVHRDLKPENILMSKENDEIYIVDFGISKQYRVNGEHILGRPFRNDKTFMGTPRYASLAAHLGYEIARKDDLESLFFVILYFLRGSLPWQNLPVNENERTKAVGDLKQRVDFNDLCINQPHELVEIFTYLRGLNFSEQPDYTFILGLLNQIADNNQFMINGIYDWTEGIMKSTNKFSSLESKKSGEFGKQQKDNSPGNLMKSSSKISQHMIWTINDHQNPMSQQQLLQLPDRNIKPNQRTDQRHQSNSSSNSPVGSFSSMRIRYLPTKIENEKPTLPPKLGESGCMQSSQYSKRMDENNNDVSLMIKYLNSTLSQAANQYKPFNKFLNS